MIPDKKLIEQRFAKAAHTYEQQAGIQQIVADRLLAMLDQALVQEPNSILEIGCCTGLFTAKIIKRFQSIERLIATDLVAAFEPMIQKKLAVLGKRGRFISSDIETLEIDVQYELILSSSTFHWIYDLQALLKKLRNHLSLNGHLAFSLYGSSNLKEIRTLTGIGLPYHPFSSLHDQISQHFEIIAAEEATETLWFKNPMSVLKHIRQTGVNAVGSKVWTKSQLKKFIEEYEQLFASDLGVPLTYHPMYFILRPLQ